jgi:hypothetical protein
MGRTSREKRQRGTRRTVLARLDFGHVEVTNLELLSAGLRENGGLELGRDLGLHFEVVGVCWKGRKRRRKVSGVARSTGEGGDGLVVRCVRRCKSDGKLVKS